MPVFTSKALAFCASSTVLNSPRIEGIKRNVITSAKMKCGGILSDLRLSMSSRWEITIGNKPLIVKMLISLKPIPMPIVIPLSVKENIHIFKTTVPDLKKTDQTMKVVKKM